MRSAQAILLLLSLALAATTACDSPRTSHNTQAPTDERSIIEEAFDLYSSDSARAMAFVDSVEADGGMTHFQAQFARARMLSQDIHSLETAREIGEELLESDEVKYDKAAAFNVLELLASVARLRRDDYQWLKWATQLAEVCHGQGYEPEALRTEAEIGVVLTRVGRRDEGMAMLDNAIARLDGVRRFGELDASIIAMKRKINVLADRYQYEPMIPLARRIIERLDDYALHPADYADGSYRMPADTCRSEYIDFYRAQALAYLARAQAFTGQADAARTSVAQFEKLPYSEKQDGQLLIAPAWCALGDYAKMSTAYGEALRQMGPDTLNAQYAEMLEYQAMAASARGFSAASQDYWRRHAKLTTLLTDSLMASKAHDYAARYHAQEQQLLLQRKEAEIERKNIAVGIGLLVALLAVGVALITVQRRRQLESKNRVLAEQIADAVEYKERYEKLRDRAMAEAASPPQPGKMPEVDGGEQPETAPKPIPAAEPNLDELDDQALFTYLSERIAGEKLFLTANFGRQDVVERFGISERRVGAAFSHGSSRYTSLPDFIRDCRLTHACQLLVARPEMSVGDVAEASGFSNASVFSRDFKHKYTLSPTDYRVRQVNK